jgi:asparagine synthase (glutamine-hydrolysing)
VPVNTDGESVAVEKKRMLLETRVKRQLVSDVPVGIFLSGDIDFSAVTAFASRHYSAVSRPFRWGLISIVESTNCPRQKR